MWVSPQLCSPPPTRPQFRTLKPEEQRQALRSLELHYQAFLRDSQDAGGFGPEDRLQAEREYGSCSRHYQQLLQSLEQGRCGQCGGWWDARGGPPAVGRRANWMCSPGEQEESRCQRCISELKDIRLQLEACETRTVHRLRLPLDKEPAREAPSASLSSRQAPAPPPPTVPYPAPGSQGCCLSGS